MEKKIFSLYDFLIFGCGFLAGICLATGIYFENITIALGGFAVAALIGGVCFHLRHRFS